MAMSSICRIRWFSGAIDFGRATISGSRKSVTTCRAPVSSTVWRHCCASRTTRSAAYEFGKTFEKACLRGLRRPGGEKVALHGRAQTWRPAEEFARLGDLEAGEPRRFEKCRAA